MKYDNIKLQFLIDMYRIHIMRVSYGKIDWIIPMHSHSDNSYEIHYITAGKGTVIMNGISYAVDPHTLFVTGPLISHEQIPDSTDPMIEYCFNICIETEPTDSADQSFLSPFVRTSAWLGQDTLDIENIMELIYHELNHDDNGYPLAITGMFQYFLVLLTRLYTQNTAHLLVARQPLHQVTHFCAIEDAFLFGYKDLTIKQLAARLGLSVRQTERLLQKNYASTFKQMLFNARLSNAAAFLLAGHSTDRVAEEVGYSSVEHFRRAFKKRYHVSVRQYHKTTESIQKKD